MNVGDYKGRTGLSPPTAYHLNRGEGQCIHLSLYTQAPRLCIQKLPKSSQVLDPTDQQVKNLGIPESTMNRHLNLALILII
jgi:hypothetical protein